MTDAQANELIAVVKHCLLPEILGHPEADDMLGEAILKAYQVVESMPSDCPYRWTTLAGKAAQWQAREYLRSRRSGRISTRHSGAAVIPIPFSNLLEGMEEEKADDGGIAAADARLQLWLTPEAPRPPVTGCRWCGGELPRHADGQIRSFYCSRPCYRRYSQRQYRLRRRQNARQANSSPVEGEK